MKGLNAILAASGLILALSLPSWAQEVKQLTHGHSFGHRGNHRS